MSILPKNADTAPSLPIAMYEESCSGTSGGLVPCAYAERMPSTVLSEIGAPTDTTNAPPAISMARRERAAGF